MWGRWGGPLCYLPSCSDEMSQEGLGPPGPGGEVALRQQRLCHKCPLTKELPALSLPTPTPQSLKPAVHTQRAHVLWKQTDLCSDPMVPLSSGVTF